MATYLKIHRQVEVVKLLRIVCFNHSQDVLLRKAHGNVANHQCCKRFLPIKNCEKIDLIVCWIAKGWFGGDSAYHRFLVVVGILREFLVLIDIEITFCFIYSIRLVDWLKTKLLVQLLQFMNA